MATSLSVLRFRVLPWLCTIGCALVLVASEAFAADRGLDRVGVIASDAEVLGTEVAEMRRNFTERRGLIGVTDARDRYEEGVYQFLIGDYKSAATTFYILVTAKALATPDLARDSEWYLAECLFELDNYRTALEHYKTIVDAGRTHPYFPDAVRRSLETFAILRENASFDQYYRDYIDTRLVPTSDVISYTLAKSFYRRGESGRSKAMFEVLAPGTPYYSRARYFLGVQMIQEKNYTQAISEFELAVKDPITDEDHRRVNELAELALARLYYETGNMAEAVVWYNKLSPNSPNYADQLYETAWAEIKRAGEFEAFAAEQEAEATPAPGPKIPGMTAPKPAVSRRATEAWQSASEEVDIFLKQFPQHRYTASMKILQGHLHMKLKDYDTAEQNYERVVAEYDPVVARLGEIKTDSIVTGRFLDQLTDDKKGATEDLLPGYAEEILLSRGEVGRAAMAWGSLQQQRAELKDSDDLIQVLRGSLGDESRRLGTFTAATSELGRISGAALSLQGRLIDAEVAALRSAVPARRVDLGALQRRRDEALVDSTTAPAALAEIRKSLAAFRAEAADPAAFGAVDRVWSQLQALEQDVRKAAGVIAEAEVREMSAVRETLKDTEASVVVLHKDVALGATTVEGLAQTAVQAGVRAVEAEFRTDVLTADKGIVDVAWLRKGATTDEMDLLEKERERLLKSLREQYALLRRNAGDGESQ